jgi:lycopene beta-cyclase
MAAGLFQPMTGYSLPDAVSTAALVAALPDLSSAALARALRAHASAAWTGRGFYRLLARLLFRAADPVDRYGLLERFYSFDEALIGRFYAGRSTLADKARVLIGKPPVPLRRAFAALRET